MQIPKFNYFKLDKKEEVNKNVELLSGCLNNNFDLLSNSLLSLKKTIGRTESYINDLPIIAGKEVNPNGNYRAKAGSIYRNTNGGVGVTLWVKETEEDSNLGWFPLGNANVATYAYLTLGTDQVSAGITAGTKILFNTMSSGNVSFNSALSQVTLEANKTYRMMAACSTSCSGAGYLEPQFYNITTGGYIGTAGEGVTTTYASNLANQPAAFVTITPTVETVVEVRAFAVGGTPTKVWKNYSFWEIQQIVNNSTTITQVDTSIKDYGMFSHSGNPDTTYINTGDKIPNNYTIQGNGGIIADTANRTYQLKANKLYKLSSEVLASFSATGGVACFMWYDEETSSYIGSRTYIRPLTYTTSIGITSNSVAFLRTTKNQSVSLRIGTQTNLAGTYGSNGGYSWFLIEEIQRF